jgi:2'-5' RNA ligase
MINQRDPRQMLLFDAPPAVSPRALALAAPHNYFYALRPPPPIADAISGTASDLAQHHDAKLPMPPERLHISLCNLGRYPIPPTPAIDHMMVAGAAVHVAPFNVAFDRVLSWGRAPPWPVVLRCCTGEAEIAALHRATATAVGRAGLRTRHAPGTPHLTLWRNAQPFPERVLAQPFCWCVTEFWLIHSIHGTGTHSWPGQWPLLGAPLEPLQQDEPLLL